MEDMWGRARDRGEERGGASEVAVAVASQYFVADERVGHSWSASESESD